MISLKRIVEQQGTDGQFYDLGMDFANFRRSIDGSFDQIKQKFEQVIGAKLNGKRVRARSSRGYKQYVKDYEFDVTKITLDDYYDNYVVVAHDNTTPKAKEYFLKPGFKIQILGQANGQPATGAQAEAKPTQPEQSQEAPAAQPQQMVPAAPSTQSVKEDKTGHYDAYAIDTIAEDIKHWLKLILRKPETAIRDFVPNLGWLKNLGNGKSVAMFDVVIPVSEVKVKLTPDSLNKLVQSANKDGEQFSIVSSALDKAKGEVTVRVKKITDGKSV